MSKLLISNPLQLRSTSHFCLGHSALGAMLSFFNSPPSPQERKRERMQILQCVATFAESKRFSHLAYSHPYVTPHSSICFFDQTKQPAHHFEIPLSLHSSIQQLTEKCRLSKSPTTLPSSGTGPSSTTTVSSRLGLLSFARK